MHFDILVDLVSSATTARFDILVDLVSSATTARFRTGYRLHNV